MFLLALGLQDQVIGTKSRVTSFYPKIQLWKELLIRLNLLHRIAVVKSWDEAVGKGGTDTQTCIPNSVSTRTFNSELKFKLTFLI